MIPLVAASEMGKVQTEPVKETLWECGVIGLDYALTYEAELAWKGPP